MLSEWTPVITYMPYQFPSDNTSIQNELLPTCLNIKVTSRITAIAAIGVNKKF
jgi:hypothetical protein